MSKRKGLSSMLLAVRKYRAVLVSLVFLAGVMTDSAGVRVSSALTFTSTKTTVPSVSTITKSISPVLQEKLRESFLRPFLWRNFSQRFSPHRPSSSRSANNFRLFSNIRENPKLEYLNPKQIRNSNTKCSKHYLQSRILFVRTFCFLVVCHHFVFGVWLFGDGVVTVSMSESYGLSGSFAEVI